MSSPERPTALAPMTSEAAINDFCRNAMDLPTTSACAEEVMMDKPFLEQSRVAQALCLQQCGHDQTCNHLCLGMVMDSVGAAALRQVREAASRRHAVTQQ